MSVHHIGSSLCLYILHPPWNLIASLLHLLFILLTSSRSHILISYFSCISSTYSFYNPLFSASSFHYFLTFLICTNSNLISKEKMPPDVHLWWAFFWREQFCLASRHTILRCLFFHHEFQKWKNLIMMIYCMVVRLFGLLQSNHSDPQSNVSIWKFKLFQGNASSNNHSIILSYKFWR